MTYLYLLVTYLLMVISDAHARHQTRCKDKGLTVGGGSSQVSIDPTTQGLALTTLAGSFLVPWTLISSVFTFLTGLFRK